jgi:hypothetical protein
MLLELLGKIFDRYVFWLMGKHRFSLRTPADLLDRLAELEPTGKLRAAVSVGAAQGLQIGPPESTPELKSAFRRWRCASPTGDDEPRGLLFGEPQARRGLLYVHGWLQPAYTGFAELAAYHVPRGTAVWCLELPHHLTRTSAGELSGARFISGDVGETVLSFIRGLTEVAALLALLRRRHAEALSLGHSLGGLLTGLHACLAATPQHRAALLTPAVAPLSILAESPLTTNVRADVLAQGISYRQLEPVLRPVNLLNYRPRGPASSILLVAARSDQVIPLLLQRRLRDAWGCRYHEARTGHLGVMLPLALFRRPVGLWRRIVDHLCPPVA